jgi:hypothetical protein
MNSWDGIAIAQAGQPGEGVCSSAFVGPSLPAALRSTISMVSAFDPLKTKLQ